MLKTGGNVKEQSEAAHDFGNKDEVENANPTFIELCPNWYFAAKSLSDHG